MKTKYLFIGLMISALTLVGCSSNFLNQEPSGSSLSQNQFDQLQGTVEGQVRGLYSMLIAYGGSHDTFGQKSLDITTDLMSSDMAMTADSYGWFVDAARMTCATSTSSRTSYIWSYYYTLIRNCNLAIRNLQNLDMDGDENLQNYYAQALTMRGYCYYNLAILFNSPCYSVDSEDLQVVSVPIYTENTPEKTPQGLATLGEVYDQIETDLTNAITYFESSASIPRASKLQFDIYMAKAFLAYSYLNKGDYANAYTTAKEVIDADEYTIIPSNKLTTTGFVSVADPSWMWGSITTIDNYTGLASFFGQVDIHTYSYAWAGAYKVIDERLYGSIPEADLRKAWFNKDKRLVPDWKFYDLNRGETEATIDRNWLNDLVFMRVEEMYLIAAEAAERNGNTADATAVLKSLTDERYNGEIPSTTFASLSDEIYYNWRIEMWGEGRALQVFKRYQATVQRGSNHFAFEGQEFNGTDLQFIFQIPYSETTTNPELEI